MAAHPRSSRAALDERGIWVRTPASVLRSRFIMRSFAISTGLESDELAWKRSIQDSRGDLRLYAIGRLPVQFVRRGELHLCRFHARCARNHLQVRCSDWANPLADHTLSPGITNETALNEARSSHTEPAEL